MSLSSFCKHLGIHYPIILAPMAGDGVSIPLICEMAASHGLASLGAGYMTEEVLDATLTLIKNRTQYPLMVNFFARHKEVLDETKARPMASLLKPFADEFHIELPTFYHQELPSLSKQIETALKHHIKIMSFTFGAPDEATLATLKKHQVFLIGTATNEKEGLYLKKLGFDAIVAQGKEAGGHRGTFLTHENEGLISTFALTSLLRDSLRLPIIASGGIMDASDITQALDHGATAVQLGTAFLTTHESAIDASYKQELLSQDKDHTILSAAFSGKLARVIPNRFTNALKGHEDLFLPYPYQHYLTKPIRDAAKTMHIKDVLALFSGQRSFLCQSISCEDLMKELAKAFEHPS